MRLVPKALDTSDLDDAWPEVAETPSVIEQLVTLVRQADTGRARPEQTALRARVAKMLDRMGVRDIVVGAVRFHLGPDRFVSNGDGYDIRTGALRVTLLTPRAPKQNVLGVNITHVRQAMQTTPRAGVIFLDDYRAERSA